MTDEINFKLMSDQHLASFFCDAIHCYPAIHPSFFADVKIVKESSSINTSIEPSPREEEAGDAGDAMPMPCIL